jgi:DNA-binding LacI/PurR family transcriptional regulator
VAAAVGVSRATVSNAYNRPDQLSPALRDRVLRTAAELGYGGPDPAARGLRRGRVGAVAYLLNDPLQYTFSDPAARAFVDGLAEVLEPSGTGLLILPGSEGGGPAPVRIREAVVDGIVSASPFDDDPAIDAARARGLPLVLVDHRGRPGDVAVRVDDRRGAEVAARHLLELGHRRCAVVTFELHVDRRSGLADADRMAGTVVPVAVDRLTGYRRALAGGGVDWDDVPVWECAFNARQQAREATATLLDRRPRPTAILALSDELAIGAMQAVHDRGLDVPGDVSVVGFDDTEEAEAATPPLTTVHQPLRRKGELAGRLLLDLQAGKPVSRPRPLPTRLVVRSSTARPRSR